MYFVSARNYFGPKFRGFEVRNFGFSDFRNTPFFRKINTEIITDFILRKNRVIFLKNAKKICGGHTCHFFFRRKKNFALFILATFFPEKKTEKREGQRPRCNWGRKSCGGAKIICAKERVVNHKEMTRQKFKMHRFICGIHAGDLWVKHTFFSLSAFKSVNSPATSCSL